VVSSQTLNLTLLDTNKHTMPSGSKLAVRPEATEAEPPASEAAGVEKSSSAVLMLPAAWHYQKGTGVSGGGVRV
jgi:hypothetical protein